MQTFPEQFYIPEKTFTSESQILFLDVNFLINYCKKCKNIDFYIVSEQIFLSRTRATENSPQNTCTFSKLLFIERKHRSWCSQILFEVAVLKTSTVFTGKLMCWSPS